MDTDKQFYNLYLPDSYYLDLRGTALRLREFGPDACAETCQLQTR